VREGSRLYRKRARAESRPCPSRRGPPPWPWPSGWRIAAGRPPSATALRPHQPHGLPHPSPQAPSTGGNDQSLYQDYTPLDYFRYPPAVRGAHHAVQRGRGTSPAGVLWTLARHGGSTSRAWSTSCADLLPAGLVPGPPRPRSWPLALVGRAARDLERPEQTPWPWACCCWPPRPLVRRRWWDHGVSCWPARCALKLTPPGAGPAAVRACGRGACRGVFAAAPRPGAPSCPS